MIISQQTISNLEQDPGVLSIHPYNAPIMVKGRDKPVSIYVRDRQPLMGDPILHN